MHDFFNIYIIHKIFIEVTKNMVSTFNPLSSFVIEKSEKKDRKINVKTHS